MVAPETALHGGDVWQGGSPEGWLDYSANLRPEGPPAWVLEAMAGALALARYYPDPAMAQARRGLAAYAGLPESCLWPTAGGIAAIDAVCRLQKGRVLIPDITFAEYARRAASAGRQVVSGPLPPLGEGDTVFLCNPNNPTGAARSRKELLPLLERVKAAGAMLAVDEAFIDYCPEYSLRGLVPGEPALLVLGSLTKILGVPGVRLGYVCAQESVLLRLGESLPPWGLNCFAAAVARELPAHLQELRAEEALNRQRRERFAQALRPLARRVYPSQANFLLADFGRPTGEIAEKLRQQGILVRQCLSFPGLEDGCHLRLAVKTDAENRRLTAALAQLLPKEVR